MSPSGDYLHGLSGTSVCFHERVTLNILFDEIDHGLRHWALKPL